MKKNCRKWHFIVLFSLFLLPAKQAFGQNEEYRPVMSSNMFGFGYSSMYDTYLSPLTYEGLEIRFTHESIRLLRRGNDRFSMQSIFNIGFDGGSNSAETANDIMPFVDYSHGIHYRIPCTPKLSVLVGGMLNAHAGMIYNSHNSNNPISIKYYAQFMPSAMAIYHFNIGKVPAMLRYQLNAGLIGAAYAPHYHQLLGTDEDTDIGYCVTSLHNDLTFHNYITLDLPFRRMTLRIAYWSDFLKTDMHELNTHINTHALMIGISKEFVSFGGRRAHNQANLKHPMY